jgi:hypothetical protein
MRSRPPFSRCVTFGCEMPSKLDFMNFHFFKRTIRSSVIAQLEYLTIEASKDRSGLHHVGEARRWRAGCRVRQLDMSVRGDDANQLRGNRPGGLANSIISREGEVQAIKHTGFELGGNVYYRAELASANFSL